MAPYLHSSHGSGVELWLARHAEVHEDWQGKAYGDLDVPLSADGVERTRELGPELAGLLPARVLSSPLARARVLGEAIARPAGLELELEPDLREIHRGRWQGKSVGALYDEEPDAVARFYADPWSWREHGGESDAMLSARAFGVLDRALAGATVGARIVVASHYNVIRVIAAGLLGIPSPASFGFRVDPGRLVVFRDTPAGWTLLASNLVSPRAAC